MAKHSRAPRKHVTYRAARRNRRFNRDAEAGRIAATAVALPDRLPVLPASISDRAPMTQRGRDRRDLAAGKITLADFRSRHRCQATYADGKIRYRRAA